MDSLHSREVDNLFKGILTLKTVEECYDFFEDACTIKEIMDIAQRFEVAGLLKQGISYTQVSKETGASTATISRVNRCLTYGSGGYGTVLERLADNGEESENIE